MKYLLSFCLVLGAAGLVDAQQTIEESGMTLQYVIEGEYLHLTLTAPMTGWVAIGFNSENNIVGSDLKMMGLRDGKPYTSDQYVTGVGKHPSDVSLGSQVDIDLIRAEELDGNTTMVFRLPMTNEDKWDFQHTLKEPFWLILAYSVSDDLDHHSRVRRHVYISWAKGRL